MENIRNYLLSDSALFALIGNNMFLVEKPAQIKRSEYIVYFFKELSGGYIKSYSIEFNIFGKDLNKLLKIKDRIIDLLDAPRNERVNNIGVRSSALLNGGGISKDNTTGNYAVVTYFKIIV